jgi:cell division septation protein DedD
MNIEHYLSDLLYEYDCVIIPGLGGFIGNNSPSRVNSIHHTFFPPCKSLLFNINLKQNDGLLANRIVQDKKISYEEAMESIRSFVNQCKASLKEGKRIRLMNIGTLYVDNRRTLQFDQDKETNYLLDSYGLSSFVSLPVQRHGAHPAIEKMIPRTSGSSPVKAGMVSKTLKWAAILAIPFGAAVLFGIANFDTLKNIPVSYSGLLYPSQTSLSAPPSPKKVKMSLHPEGQTLALASNALPAEETHPATVTPHESSSVFGIIIGAFKIRENADRLVADLNKNGHEASIFDETRTGLFRVSLQNFADREEALNALAIIRDSEFPAAWLLEK